MANATKERASRSRGKTSRTASVAEPELPRSAAIAANGVKSSTEFSQLMSALMSDVISGTIKPDVARAAVGAGGKLLKLVEMELRYGTPSNSPGSSPLPLCN